MKNDRMVAFRERLDLGPFMAPGRPQHSCHPRSRQLQRGIRIAALQPLEDAHHHRRAHHSVRLLLFFSQRRGLLWSCAQPEQGVKRVRGMPGALDSGATEYGLYGSIVHEGLRASTDSGHYVAYVRTADGAWWECNDNQARARALLLAAGCTRLPLKHACPKLCMRCALPRCSRGCHCSSGYQVVPLACSA